MLAGVIRAAPCTLRFASGFGFAQPAPLREYPPSKACYRKPDRLKNTGKISKCFKLKTMQLIII